MERIFFVVDLTAKASPACRGIQVNAHAHIIKCVCVYACLCETHTHSQYGGERFAPGTKNSHADEKKAACFYDEHVADISLFRENRPNVPTK